MKAPTLENSLWAMQHKEGIGRRLTLLREALGHSRYDWHKRYKMSPSKLSQYESGTNYPDIRFMVSLCEEYGVTLDWLYRGQMHGVASWLAVPASASGGRPAAAPAGVDPERVIG